MRNNQPITQQAVQLKEGCHLVSSTNLKGVITHCNRHFVDISGFSSDELIGSPHNLVRHPDMPPAAFDDMWNTLKDGRHWIGIVKNRCKNGDHYWVDAYVTPLYDQGKVVGYESVRVKPSAQQVERAEIAYRRINQGKAPIPSSSNIKPYAMLYAPWLLVLVALIIGSAGPLITALAFVASLFSLWLSRFQMNSISEKARRVADTRLMTWIYTGRTDVCGDIEFALHTMDRRLQTVLVRVADNTERLQAATSNTVKLSSDTLSRVKQQHTYTVEVERTSQEIQTAADKLAENNQQSSDASNTASSTAQRGQNNINDMMNQTGTLQQELKTTASAIEDLAEETLAVNRFLQAISDIAEQTNLLALNAAIEAARAGEQGRGFAVVADEVRTLAQRAQESAGEIQTIVNGLNQHSEHAVKAMKKGQESTAQTLANAQQVTEVFSTINNELADIQQIAGANSVAVDQQNSAANDISQHLLQLEGLSDEAEKLAQDMNGQCDELSSLMEEQSNIIRRFQQGL